MDVKPDDIAAGRGADEARTHGNVFAVEGAYIAWVRVVVDQFEEVSLKVNRPRWGLEARIFLVVESDHRTGRRHYHATDSSGPKHVGHTEGGSDGLHLF